MYNTDSIFLSHTFQLWVSFFLSPFCLEYWTLLVVSTRSGVTCIIHACVRVPRIRPRSVSFYSRSVERLTQKCFHTLSMLTFNVQRNIVGSRIMQVSLQKLIQVFLFQYELTLMLIRIVDENLYIAGCKSAFSWWPL